MTGYSVVEDETSWMGYSMISCPILFNNDDNTYAKLDKGQTDILGTMVTDNGTVLGGTPGDGMIRDAFIAEGPEADFLPLIDYIKAQDNALYDWAVENITHAYIFEDWIENETTGEWEEKIWTEDHLYLGTPVANDDLTVFATWLYNGWSDDFNDPYFYSYVLPINKTVGLKGILNNANLTMAVANGNIAINGEAQNVTVYDLNGRMVFTLDAPGSNVATGLAKGAYIVKVTAADGTTTTKKAIF